MYKDPGYDDVVVSWQSLARKLVVAMSSNTCFKEQGYA